MTTASIFEPEIPPPGVRLSTTDYLLDELHLGAAKPKAPSVMPSVSDAARRQPIDAERVARLHQFYRDDFSNKLHFPDIGNVPSQLIDWVLDRANVDVPQLAALLQEFPNSALSADHDAALRQMLYAILQANLVSDKNNRFKASTPPQALVESVKSALGRILVLHPCDEYFINCIQLLYRMNQIEDVLNFGKAHPDIFEQHPSLRGLTGFLHTMSGNYDAAVEYLQPIVEQLQMKDLPLTLALAFMTCQFRRGASTDWPLDFSSLDGDGERLADLLSALPPLVPIQPLADGSNTPVIFVACDNKYFNEHAKFLAYSLHRQNRGRLALHLHLYSPSADTLNAVKAMQRSMPELAIGISAEHGSVPIANVFTYYASMRFVRAHQMQVVYRRDVCVIDADALFNLSWDKLESRLPANADLALACPSIAPFWEQVLAGFVLVRDTPVGQRFLRGTAHFIANNLVRNNSMWFMDQVALAAENERLADMPGSVARFDHATLIDMAHGDDALCWAVTTQKTGNRKYERVKEELAQIYESV